MSSDIAVVLGLTIVIVAGVFAALAGLVAWQSRRIERRNPPIGRFLTVNRHRLHYLERGQGRPVVLLHGNASLMQDFTLSLVDPLSQRYRVITFDRPGYGYSDRSKDTTWGPEAQMELLRQALRPLQVERPLIYGHSWATLIALAWAIRHPDELSAIVVASGYYYPYPRPDSLLAALNAAPVIGLLNRNTVSPLTAGAVGKGFVKVMFSPNPLPEYYERFPADLAVRPQQLRASGEEGMVMRESAARLAPEYPTIRIPVTILAGEADRIVSYQDHAVRLHRDIPGSRLQLFPDTGHMVHHVRLPETVTAIDQSWSAEPAARRAAGMA